MLSIGHAKAAASSLALSLLCACTSSKQPPPGTIGSSLGVPIVAGEPPPPGSARLQPQGSIFAPTPPPFGTPRDARQEAAQPIYERTRISERSTVAPDGSVRTETTRASVSFDPNKAAGALGALVSAGHAQGGIPGAWQMQSSSNGMMCSVFLYGQPGAVSGAATSSGCPMGGIMSGITNWTYDGGRLTIAKGGSTAITLNQMGPNRFDGTATWGFLSTRIALYR